MKHSRAKTVLIHIRNGEGTCLFGLMPRLHARLQLNTTQLTLYGTILLSYEIALI